MKKAIVGFVILIAMQTSLFAQISNPDTMIHKLFAALKAKDEKAFVALHPTAKQWGAMMRTIMKAEFDLDKNRRKNFTEIQMNQQIESSARPENFFGLEELYSDQFKAMIEAGQAKGIKWEEAKLTSYTMDSSFLKEVPANYYETAKKSGIKNINGIIEFFVDDSAYQIRYASMMFIPSEAGWFGGRFVRLMRKGKPEPPDEIETREIVVESSQDAPEPPPPPPKKKVKAKTKKKTKAKS